MRTLLIDIETRSRIPIGECGAYRYVEDDSFAILLFGYSVDGAPARVVDLTAREQIPPDVAQALYDPSVTKAAYNAAFERTALTKRYGRYCAPEQWLDVMVVAASCGLPLGLDACCTALGLPEDQAKLKTGKQLIRRFCVPDKKGDFRSPSDDAENWELFKTYCARDVNSEQLIWNMLNDHDPDEKERAIYCLDARINDSGIRADLTLANRAMEMDARYKSELSERAVELTGLDNPNSVAQVKAWLQEQEGISVPTLNKKAVQGVLEALQTDRAKAFMDIRSELSKTSTKKYEAFVRCACADEHIRGCFQFFGSHTGRWAGRLVQLQNLPQNKLEDLDDVREFVRAGDYDFIRAVYPSVTSVLSELIRTVLIPEEGHKFCVADFSAIEARVSAWMTGETWVLDAFRRGEDIYCATASQMFKVPVTKHGINGNLRQKGKIATLACGYAGGVGALKAFGADRMGLTNEEMSQIIDSWRAANPHIAASWKSLQNAAVRCIARRTETTDRVCGIRFRYDDLEDVMWMRLPSGREMAYPQPAYKPSEYNSAEMSISYMGVNQTKRKWQRIETRGGRIFENAVQATARDVLREAMLSLHDNGWDIRAHVHDEVICTEPLDGRNADEMARVMCPDIPWAAGLPLKAEGYECSSYRKD